MHQHVHVQKVLAAIVVYICKYILMGKTPIILHVYVETEAVEYLEIALCFTFQKVLFSGIEIQKKTGR